MNASSKAAKDSTAVERTEGSRQSVPSMPFRVLDTADGGQDILIGGPELDAITLLDTVSVPSKAAASAKAGG